MPDPFKELDAMMKEAQETLNSIAAGACGCWKCIHERKQLVVHMVLCPTCGNKRCPKASDHELACTGSNEPGQKGSIYE